ncbi:GGDEF domain-containing protein [Rhodococcus sp. BP-316]|uniref:putative bifunctional diguanylate cyclase/phosphodiesterase n=1 Tax=Rhodococcus sp. BP-316 TaxID=2739445 RepID=UPI001C9ABD60|nr:bifunctional diguanylate cyclase/phosphodiesterase [Rhodococcus sp. BP-316]MBY6682736.1 GGDEF domain-containing protein [Rhodococcus sp. BP-316]
MVEEDESMVSTPVPPRLTAAALDRSRLGGPVRSPGRYLAASFTVAAVVLAVYLIVPASIRTGVFAVGAIGCMVVVLVGLRRNSPTDTYAWRCMLGAATSFLVGLSARSVRADLPSAIRLLPEVLVLLGYLLLVLGIVGWSRRGGNSRPTPTIIDAVLVTLGMTFVSWVLLVAPVLSTTRDVPSVVLNGLFPAIDAGLFTMAFFLLLSKSRFNVSLVLLVAALLVTIVGDLGYAIATARSVAPPAVVLDAMYLLAFVLLAAASLHPSMAWVGRAGGVTAALTRQRMTVSVALVATCAALPLVGDAVGTADVVVRSTFLAVILVGMFVRGERALSRVQRSEDKARHDATHDSLTGLPDRSMLESILERAARRPSSSASATTVLFADLDNFKVVNDSYGHRAGDELIQAAAQRIRRVVSADEDVVRYAGDEFVVVAHCDRARAEELAELLLAAFAEPFELSVASLYVSVSIGIATSCGPAGLADDLVREADTAMYDAKFRGPAAYAFFDESLRTAATRSVELGSALRGAVARGEMAVHYQPIVSLRTHDVLVYEALVRWKHRGRWVGPDEFIPVAEATNMISEIGTWVLDTALGDLVRLRAAGAPRMSMSVNLSVLQLRDERLPEVVADLLASHGLDGSVLGLEVTESALIADPVVANRVLARLAEQDIVLVLDDFGMGYSSLGRLRDLPITVIKIDKSFIDRVPVDDASVSIVTAIEAMATALTMRTVAEGVETTEQERIVTELGCTYAQGYLYGRPAPVETFLS